MLTTSGYVKNLTYSEIIKRINREFIPKIDWSKYESSDYDRVSDSYKHSYFVKKSMDITSTDISKINTLTYGTSAIILPNDINFNVGEKHDKIYKFNSRAQYNDDEHYFIIYPFKNKVKFLEFTSYQSVNRVYITSINHEEDTCDLSFDLERLTYYKDYYIDSLSYLYLIIMNYYNY